MPTLRHIDFSALDIEVVRRGDGSVIARSPFALGGYDARVTDWLDFWAARAPSRIFLVERDTAGRWRSLTYAEARAQTRALAQALLGRALSAERPLVILSGNSIAHALLALAALYVGIPYAPISPAYAQGREFSRLQAIIALLTPELVFVDEGPPFAKAIAAAVPEHVEILTGRSPLPGRNASEFASFIETPETAALDAARDAVGPNTIAKFLFTSGSTGAPKGVITTHRMLCANQAMIASCLRFLRAEPPVLVDWLPWHHSFGGNQNFNLALYRGGTLYIDTGRPTPEGIGVTLANLREVAPTHYFNVPRGFETLLPHLARDKALTENFFARLKLAFFAGAPFPRHRLDALAKIADKKNGERVMMMSGYGATETSPAALFWTPATCATGGVGLPLPGTELKLVPHGSQWEVRIKGPHVTPGYWRCPDLCPFDEEGYFRLGDALSFAEEAAPGKGFRFEGRLDENFKLATGAWVGVAALREEFIAAFAPYVKDVAIAGPGEPELAALVFPDLEACRTLACLEAGAPPEEILRHPAVLERFRALPAGFSTLARGSSRRIARIALVHEPPSILAGELTDKGSLNQNRVLANRVALVRDLYAGRIGFETASAPPCELAGSHAR